ncbi:MAG: hypothetical protein GXP19_09570 [Gammaproteobacteria bacterium]|nr:hypothetical protein [Gammaproteobacteria bacterium]
MPLTYILDEVCIEGWVSGPLAIPVAPAPTALVNLTTPAMIAMKKNAQAQNSIMHLHCGLITKIRVLGC